MVPDKLQTMDGGIFSFLVIYIYMFLMFYQIRRLALVEMAALFDTGGIDLKTHKAVKLKTKGTHNYTHTRTFATEAAYSYI